MIAEPQTSPKMACKKLVPLFSATSMKTKATQPMSLEAAHLYLVQ